MQPLSVWASRCLHACQYIDVVYMNVLELFYFTLHLQVSHLEHADKALHSAAGGCTLDRYLLIQSAKLLAVGHVYM